MWRDGESLEDYYRRRRPWRVHVREIGPDYSFGSEARAHERALVLLSEYATVDVWESVLESSRLWPMRRTVWRTVGGLPHATVEILGPDTGYRWDRVYPRDERGTGLAVPRETDTDYGSTAGDTHESPAVSRPGGAGGRRTICPSTSSS